jgi:hypothetical protein
VVKECALLAQRKRHSEKWGGAGWIIEPEEGQVLGLTSADEPFLTLGIDLKVAETAKKTYPRYVAEENELKCLKFEMVRKSRHEGFNEFNPTRIQLVPGDAFAHSGTGGCGIRHGGRAASAFR